MMAESAGLIVEMIDDQIVVTMSGTLFLAAYRKRQGWLRSPLIFCKMIDARPYLAPSLLRVPGESPSPKRESSAGLSDFAGRFWQAAHSR